LEYIDGLCDEAFDPARVAEMSKRVDEGAIKAPRASRLDAKTLAEATASDAKTRRRTKSSKSEATQDQETLVEQERKHQSAKKEEKIESSSDSLDGSAQNMSVQKAVRPTTAPAVKTRSSSSPKSQKRNDLLEMEFDDEDALATLGLVKVIVERPETAGKAQTIKTEKDRTPAKSRRKSLSTEKRAVCVQSTTDVKLIRPALSRAASLLNQTGVPNSSDPTIDDKPSALSRTASLLISQSVPLRSPDTTETTKNTDLIPRKLTATRSKASSSRDLLSELRNIKSSLQTPMADTKRSDRFASSTLHSAGLGVGVALVTTTELRRRQESAARQRKDMETGEVKMRRQPCKSVDLDGSFSAPSKRGGSLSVSGYGSFGEFDDLADF
jgi:hypothetical protein